MGREEEISVHVPALKHKGGPLESGPLLCLMRGRCSSQSVPQGCSHVYIPDFVSTPRITVGMTLGNVCHTAIVLSFRAGV